MIDAAPSISMLLVGTDCAPTLDAKACGVTRWGAGFHGLLSLHAGEAQAGKSMMHLRYPRIRVTRIFRAAQFDPHNLRDTLR
jgi:hypothetical protein